MNTFYLQLVSAVFSFILIITYVSGFKRPYSFVCDEGELYKPYVLLYQDGRHGAQIDLEKDANYFYEIGKYSNVYVCINGPAYLYFSVATTLGMVYETPEMAVYDHICEKYNVKPASGATNLVPNRTLQAIQLMGDRENYYVNSALQLFTAPYYDPELKLYVNATSLIIFGDDVCFLEKDGQTVLLIPPAEAKEPNKRRYCKLGYSKVLMPAGADINPDSDEEKMRQMAKKILRTDYAIRNSGCGAPGWSNSTMKFLSSLEKIRNAISRAQTKYVSLKGKEKPLKVEEQMEKLDKEITKLETEITDQKNAKKKNTLNKQKKKKEDEKKIVENLLGIHTRIKEILDPLNAELTALIKTKPADPTATEEGIQKEITELNVVIKTAKENQDEILDNTRKEMAYRLDLEKHPYKFEDLKEKIKTAIGNRGKAVEKLPKPEDMITSWKTIQKKLSDGIETIAELEFLFKAKGKKTFDELKDDINKTKSSPVRPVMIQLDKMGTMVPPNCTDLPEIKETCEKGKPDKEKSCEIFRTSLGYEAPKWTANVDEWKSEILDSIESIFSTACFRVIKKFTRNIHRIFKYYLTNKEYFNKGYGKDLAGSSPVSNPDSSDGGAAQNNDPSKIVNNEPNKEERPFWKHIRAALKECEKKKSRNMLFFKNKNLTSQNGEWVFLKRHENGNPEEKNIILHEEQADKEYYFNWVIDWQYKIFATILGLCMPSYEAKIPLITSRFYAMYTEDFIIPLRNVWVNSKDNQIYNWILGEFKHGDAEAWLERCMEASFIQAEKVEYRPLRCVLVNGGLEHNYYLNGIMAGSRDIYSKDK